MHPSGKITGRLSLAQPTSFRWTGPRPLIRPLAAACPKLKDLCQVRCVTNVLNFTLFEGVCLTHIILTPGARGRGGPSRGS